MYDELGHLDYFKECIQLIRETPNISAVSIRLQFPQLFDPLLDAFEFNKNISDWKINLSSTIQLSSENISKIKSIINTNPLRKIEIESQEYIFEYFNFA